MRPVAIGSRAEPRSGVRKRLRNRRPGLCQGVRHRCPCECEWLRNDRAGTCQRLRDHSASARHAVASPTAQPQECAQRHRAELLERLDAQAIRHHKHQTLQIVVGYDLKCVGR